MPTTRNESTPLPDTGTLSPGTLDGRRIRMRSLGNTPMFGTAAMHRIIMEYPDGLVPPETVAAKDPPAPYRIVMNEVPESSENRRYYTVTVYQGEHMVDQITEINEREAIRYATSLHREYLSRANRNLISSIPQENRLNLTGEQIGRSMRPNVASINRRTVRPEEDVVNEDGLVIPDLVDDPVADELAQLEEDEREVWEIDEDIFR